MVGVCSGGDPKERADEMEAKRKVEIRPLSSGLAEPPQEISGKSKQLLAAAIVSLLAFAFGTSIGWPSPVQRLLQSDRSPVGPLSDEDVSWLASLTFLGGICGTFIWSRIADRFGRKVAGYCVAVPFLLGWSLTAFTCHRDFLLAARFINGLGGSGSLILAPTYISEIAQDSIRGALGSFVVLYMNAGIVFAYSLGAIVDYDSLNLICLAVPILFLFLFLWMPESPEYLWSKEKKEDAHQSLMWLRNGDSKCVQDEIFNYHSKCQEASVTYSSLVASRGKRTGMMFGLVLFALQQFCGILAILSYTSFIFEKSGSSIAPERATIIVGVIQLFASFISSVIVDRSGRKILLLISYMFMGLALTSLGMYFYMDHMFLNLPALRWVPVISLSVHVLTYALGAGPVPYIIISETLPLDIRGLATSVIILCGTLLAFVSVKIFPLLIMYTGISGCFWFFSIFCYIGFIFTYWQIPETKGIPLQDILLRLNGYRGVDVL